MPHESRQTHSNVDCSGVRLILTTGMASIESDFNEFFEQCAHEGLSASEMLQICQPLIRRRRLQRAKTFAAIACLIVAFYHIGARCDWCAWLMSAVGRQLLIQLLPYWNWTSLYSARCLIDRAQENRFAPPSLGKDETHFENCLLCEDLDHIPQLSNTTFSYLESTYLERGLPAIITDSQARQTLARFLDAIDWEAETMRFLHSAPCDLATNLMLKQRFNIEFALQKIRHLNSTARWFLQLRNCEFGAVKSSRLFLHRPYYYPPHLPPFYSSWLLMAQNYARQQRDVYLHGLVVVQQLSGHFHLELRPKRPCVTVCPIASVRLSAGEALVFSTDVWSLSYAVEAGDAPTMTSIATILEIDWSL